ncbi:MAG: aspartate 1-decarboxylase [Fibrobacteria bacterium]|nr:aspartate 1-decarboxylase [Fibrobacteria bacterium]
MLRKFLKSKIHRATVTGTDLHYEGSLSLDPKLYDKAGMTPFEEIMVVNINNGQRFSTYIIPGKEGSGEVCLNGAAARLAEKGDLVIIMTFGLYHEDELKDYKPCLVHVDSKNSPV